MARACAWAGGSGQGQNKYGELWTQRPRKEKAPGMICSTEMMEQAPRGPVSPLRSINFYYLCLFQRRSEVSARLSSLRYALAGLDKSSI